MSRSDDCGCSLEFYSKPIIIITAYIKRTRAYVVLIIVYVYYYGSRLKKITATKLFNIITFIVLLCNDRDITLYRIPFTLY